MSTDHNCLQNQCTGAKCHKLNVTCSRCLNPCFIECIAKLPETRQLLILLGVNSASSSTLKEISTAIAVLFSTNSLFEFVCPSCKKIGSYNDLDKENESQSANIKSLKAKVSKITKEKSATDDCLKKKADEIENLKKQINGGQNSHKVDFSIIQTQIDSLNTIASQWSVQLQTQNENYASLLSAIEHLSANVNDSDTTTTTKTTTTSTAVNSTTANSTATETTTTTDATTDSSASVPSQGVNQDQNNGNELIINIDDEENDDDLLIPPQIRENVGQQPMSSKTGLFELYVSKFDPSVKAESVARHIIKHTKLNGNSFSVVPLVSPKENIEKKSFISFKIITLNETVYKAIFDENIWAPRFSIQPFELKSNKNKTINTDHSTQNSNVNRTSKSYGQKRTTNSSNVKFNRTNNTERKNTIRNFGKTDRNDNYESNLNQFASHERANRLPRNNAFVRNTQQQNDNPYVNQNFWNNRQYHQPPPPPPPMQAYGKPQSLFQYPVYFNTHQPFVQQPFTQHPNFNQSASGTTNMRSNGAQ